MKLSSIGWGRSGAAGTSSAAVDMGSTFARTDSIAVNSADGAAVAAAGAASAAGLGQSPNG
jgi:hypothetical protein